MKPNTSNASANRNLGAFILPILLQVIGLIVLVLPYVMQWLLGNDSQTGSRDDAMVALLYFGLPGLALALSGLAILVRRIVSK